MCVHAVQIIRSPMHLLSKELGLLKAWCFKYLLLQDRNSPLKNMGYFPSQLLMNCICKTKVTVCAEVLRPEICEDVSVKLAKKSNMYKKHYDLHAKDLQPLGNNANVTFTTMYRKSGSRDKFLRQWLKRLVRIWLRTKQVILSGEIE